MKKETWGRILTVSVFAIAMGYLEAVVVIYLRKLYYPSGFNFPLQGFVLPEVLTIEFVREIATIVMLIAVAMLAGKKFYDKATYFIYAFAVWDIFYYVFLKIVLGWPASFLSWDVLFLIPWPWIGPVLAPVLCSLLMIATAFIVLSLLDDGKKITIKFSEWGLVALGTLIVLYTWMYDYGKIIISGGYLKDFLTLAENREFINRVSGFIPGGYNWWLFIFGFLIAGFGIFNFWLRHEKI